MMWEGGINREVGLCVSLSPSLCEGGSWRQEDPRASYKVGLIVRGQ